MLRRPPYPNPDRVVYPTGYPQPFPCQLTTRVGGKNTPIHDHGAWLNPQGDGNTDVSAGHYHRVRGFRVQPDPSDGHTHELTMLPCGAGAPRVTGRDGPLMMPTATGMQPWRSLAGAGAPAGGFPWGWLLGGLVVVGAIVGAVLIAKKAGDSSGEYYAERRLREEG